jgi:c-di-GMP-binding flagellar brake protein YcgR
MENRRKYQRFKAAVAAEIELGTDIYEGVTRDLSQSGSSLFIAAPLAEGAVIQVTLLLTEDGIAAPDTEPLTLFAEVVWVTERKQNGVLAGLRFIKPSPQDTQRLAMLLSAFTATTPE